MEVPQTFSRKVVVAICAVVSTFVAVLTYFSRAPQVSGINTLATGPVAHQVFAKEFATTFPVQVVMPPCQTVAPSTPTIHVITMPTIQPPPASIGSAYEPRADLQVSRKAAEGHQSEKLTGPTAHPGHRGLQSTGRDRSLDEMEARADAMLAYYQSRRRQKQ